jgi:tetratricopeptide (TPR) repeat protein
MLPCDSEAEKAELERDIQEMLNSCSDFERISYFLGSNEYSIVPAVYYYDGAHAVLCKSWIHKQWDHVKHFARHHKTAMIVGAILVVAAVVVIATVAITSSTAAAAAAAAAASSDSDKHKSKAPEQSQTTIEEQVAVLKDTATENNVLPSLVQNDGIPDSEQGRVLGSILAHEAINETAYNTFPASSQIFDPISAGHGVTDHAFSTEQSIHYLNKEPSSNGLENHLSSDLFHQEGEQALKLGNYEQAIEHFDQAIAADSQNHDAYLQRATAYMELGEYNNSLRDYRTYSAHERPNQSFFSNTIDFGVGVAVGLPKGVGESGHQLLTFASEAATHPIDTTCNVCSAFSTLAKLAASREWEALSQSLAPEVCQLVSEWNSLSPREQGERAGYVFGKYGGDILIPGATAKVLSKGLNGAKELASVVKNLQTTEQTFALETLSQSTRGPAAFSESTATLGAAKSPFLKLEDIVVQSQNEAFLRGQGLWAWESFVKFRKAEVYLGQFQKQVLSENQIRVLIHETGIPTFPRPQGIPENYLVMLSDRGAGMKYVCPGDTGTYVRVMPGKPHSEYSYQQKPYVSNVKNGKFLDKFGHEVGRKDVEAHIPLNEFIFRD